MVEAIPPEKIRVKGPFAAALTAQLDPLLMVQHADNMMCNSEFCHVASMRFGFTGTRTVFVSKLMPWLTFLSGEVGKSVSPSEVYKNCRETPPEKLQTSETRVMFKTTVGPNDVFYVPCGYFFCEKVGAVDHASVKFPIMTTKDSETYDELVRHLTLIDKVPEMLTALADAASLNACD